MAIVDDNLSWLLSGTRLWYWLGRLGVGPANLAPVICQVFIPTVKLTWKLISLSWILKIIWVDIFDNPVLIAPSCWRWYFRIPKLLISPFLIVNLHPVFLCSLPRISRRSHHMVSFSEVKKTRNLLSLRDWSSKNWTPSITLAGHVCTSNLVSRNKNENWCCFFLGNVQVNQCIDRQTSGKTLVPLLFCLVHRNKKTVPPLTDRFPFPREWVDASAGRMVGSRAHEQPHGFLWTLESFHNDNWNCVGCCVQSE